MLAAKKSFEKDREKILSELPDNVKDMFGEIGFCAGEEDDDDDDEAENDATTADSHNFIPVLIVSPFDVPPKPVRDIYWDNLFVRAKRSKKIHNLAYLVYHYGHSDADTQYSFVEQDEFVPYEAGHAQGYDVLSPALAAKVAAQPETRLTVKEEIRVRGLQELAEDLRKPKEERKRGYAFQERHEQRVYSDRDDDDNNDDEDDDDDDDDEEESEEEEKKTKKAKKAVPAKKRRKKA